MKLPENPDARRALAEALKRLARRERFSGELQAILDWRGFSSEAVAGAVAFLEENRLLDDVRAIEAFVATRSGRRAVGRARLRDELVFRGAPEALAELAVEAIDDGDEANALENVLRSRTWLPDDRIKAARFLHSRGFDPDLIEAALGRRFGEDSD